MGVEPATVDCKTFHVDYMDCTSAYNYCMSTLIEIISKILYHGYDIPNV